MCIGTPCVALRVQPQLDRGREQKTLQKTSAQNCSTRPFQQLCVVLVVREHKHHLIPELHPMIQGDGHADNAALTPSNNFV